MSTDSQQGLTHGQQQIWVGQRLDAQSPLYNMAFLWIFDQKLDLESFAAAWRRAVEESDALMTRISETGAGAFRESGEWAIDAPAIVDLEAEANAESTLRGLCEERCGRPLPLDGPLFDTFLARLPSGRTGWYLNLHHLICDAHSTVLLYRQVAGHYAALRDGTPVADLEPFYPTAERLGTSERPSEAARTHWAARQHPLPVSLYGEPTRPSGSASTRSTLELSEATSQRLEALAEEAGFVSLSPQLSRFALFAALLTGWLHRLTGDLELGFDAPVSGRPTAAAKRALGLFMEMFPFRVRLEAGDTLRTLGARCLEEANRFLRFAEPGSSAPSGQRSSSVVLNYLPDSFGDFAGAPASADWVHSGHGDRVHALRLQVHDLGSTGRYRLHFDFNQAVLGKRLRQRSLEHFRRLMDALIEDPDRPIASVDILTPEERENLSSLEGPRPRGSAEESVIAMFRDRAETDSERVAVRENGRETSFAQLLDRAESLAAVLQRSGIEPGDRVAISSRRSTEAVVAVLATLMARAAYVPIDPAHPAERSDWIVEDCGARVLLTDESFDAAPSEAETSVMRISDAIAAGRDLPRNGSDPQLDDLAYLIYTSGSTGRPKGVLVEHRGLAEYVRWAASVYVRGDRLRFALFTSLSFDLTVTSLFLPLVSGGTVEVYAETGDGGDAALMAVANANEVDFLKLTPSHLSLLRRAGLEGSRLRCMVVGGEDLKASLAGAIHQQCGGGLEIYNEYGPTEAVVGCTLHRFDPQRDQTGSVPIGGPADGVRLRVLNEQATPVPEGVPGELWISRVGLARGYHRRPDETRARFLPDPAGAEGTFYRSGDRVRLLAPGQLVFLGRLDRQVKVAGTRVEPGEVEAALLAQPEISEAVVVMRPLAGPSERVAYCLECGLPSNYPMVSFDGEGVCNICRSFEESRRHVADYFRTMEDLSALFDQSRREHESPYDCLMLLSGGKDSSYALCRLVEMGLSVYCFSLDNGFISDGAKENMRRTTERLGVPLEIATTEAMNSIFRDSLTRFSNVCQLCFKTIYTLAIQRARELGIPLIVTGLSRGQMFETRLAPEMFRGGTRSPEEIDRAVLEARRVYHRVDDQVSRSLAVEMFDDDRLFDEIQFVDFYRFCDVGLEEVLSYLDEKAPWVRPADTGRSTNCLINDVGIYIHKKERGFHNYAWPYSWDVRLGHKTREEAFEELDDDLDLDAVRDMLSRVGYDEDRLAGTRTAEVLTSFFVADRPIGDDQLRHRLAARLPSPMIPGTLRRVDSLPLSPSGKVDEAALWGLLQEADGAAEGAPPRGPVETFLSELWNELLRCGEVSRETDFFEMGGTSLVAMEVIMRLCKEFDIELPLDSLVESSTLAELATVAEDRILQDVADLEASDQAT